MGGFRRLYPNKDAHIYTEFLAHLEGKMPYGTTTSTNRLHPLLMQLIMRTDLKSDNSINDPNFKPGGTANEADEEEDAEDEP